MRTLYMGKSVTIVAPEKFWPVFRSRFLKEDLYLRLVPRPEAVRNSIDPYRIKALIQAEDADAIILVSPRRRSPAKVLPSSVIEGVPVGILQADEIGHLEPWIQATTRINKNHEQPVWAVLAMSKRYYLDSGDRLLEWMKEGSGRDIKTERLMADIVTKDELCRRLAVGLHFAVYTGHGRSTGWSGYQVVRWEHVISEPLVAASGTIMSLACDTLKYSRGILPFGCRWVNEGRASVYVGSTKMVKTDDNAAFSELLGKVIARGDFTTIGEVMTQVYMLACSLPSNKANLALKTYRILGNPMQSVK